MSPRPSHRPMGRGGAKNVAPGAGVGRGAGREKSPHLFTNILTEFGYIFAQFKYFRKIQKLQNPARQKFLWQLVQIFDKRLIFLIIEKFM